ncbi:hypothetical protein SUGI_0396320 [Cryptomeria japonica]|nr:hypothetical protein SUGI_0396320 [Cryptomeria japonica]
MSEGMRTFMTSQMPKEEIAALSFLNSYPSYDGRGVVIAILDSGVDPAAAGLQVTSDGKPKILDILDCTGSGDIDTSKVVEADDDGYIVGASGTRLMVNKSWKNPSGEWRVGYKFVYELFTETLTARLKKERKKKWEEKHAEATLDAFKKLTAFDQKHPKPDNHALKKEREDLQNRVDYLKKQASIYEDKGPVIDAVVWNDGDVWRAAFDTQDLEEDAECGKVANFTPLTNYRTEKKYGVFSRLDACTFSVNIYNNGSILSVVTDCSPHGTHVAGITAAYHPEEPMLNGIAPGAQLISCKIGDSRLGSMETGTGLTRALIAVLENKCDLINMSYGEGTMLPDYGRFIEFANEIVNKYGVIFVSSAGNSGPALSTVTAPGGTSSSIIGIGAYVSPAMAAAAHCVVEPPAEGLEYTWSSRGPTVDGDLGVCLSAPGGAVAPVPTWTLQRRMLMNGTSMASPCACGGVALLLSAMKAECFPISPYTVRKALENTAAAIGNKPEEKLSTGQGLMQIDKAYEYLKQCKGMPSVWYQVQIKRSGNSGASMRGIYLREAYECQQTSEWIVQVKPNFHEDADKLKLLVPFEECIQIKSSNGDVIKVPEYILLTHNGRNFNILVDPTSLSEGVHYFEVYGIDCNAPWRGPLFRVPVTVMKPLYIKKNLPAISFSGLSFVAGHIERRFIEVPIGSTWIEATMRASGFDTPRKFYVNTVQICPKCRPIQWGSFVTFTSPSLKSFTFRVESSRTIEITIAEFWSSGNGSHMTTIVDLEIEFHGIMGNKEEILLSSSEAPTKIDVKALLSTEMLTPAATLTKVRVPYRPVESVLFPLPTTLDKLPSGAQIYGLTLTYKFTLAEESDVSAHVPLLNNRIYDTQFESQFYMIADTNKRVLAMGDVYPKATKLPKGDYTLRFLLRHDNTHYLEKLKKMVLFIERNLDKKSVIGLSFYSHPDGSVTGADSFNSTLLASGETQALYISPPADDKLPKDCSAGALLIGEITYGKLSLGNKKGEQNGDNCPASSEISYMVPPAAKGEEKEKEKSSARSKISLDLRLEQAVRDSKLRILSSLPRDTMEEYEEWRNLATTLKLQYPQDTELLTSILGGLVSMSLNEENRKHQKEIIDTGNDIIDSIDKDELAKYFSMKSESEDMDADETKKKMEAQREWLAEAYYRKGLAVEKIDSLKEKKVERDDNPAVASPESSDDKEKNVSSLDADDTRDLFEENYEEFRKWADVFSPKYGLLTIVRERRSKRLGTALKVLSKILEDKSKPPQKKLFNLKLALIEEIGWSHLVSYEKDWMLVLFPSDYPLF